MTLSAAFLAVGGVGMTFFPQELLVRAGVKPDGPIVLLMQMLGALYLGLAMLNWMSRGIIIGGIYARPVTAANFLHFAVASAALLKALFLTPILPQVAVISAIYAMFAIWFGFVLFTHPRAASPK